jgi:hypothetical protein
MLWPDSTSRTASFLNSSVYLPRCPFLIFVSLSLLKQLDKGQGQFGIEPDKFKTGWGFALDHVYDAIAKSLQDATALLQSVQLSESL